MTGEVLAQCSIELRCFLKRDSVPCILEPKHASIANASSESVGLSGAYQDVLARSNQKRGGIDLREAGPGRVAPNRMELSKDSAKRRRPVQANAQMRAHRLSTDRLEKLGRIEQARKGFHPSSRAAEKPFEKQPHPLRCRERGDRRSIVSGDQGKTSTAVRRTKRDLLRDHATHRNAHDVGSTPAKIVHDPNGVVGHRGNGP